MKDLQKLFISELKLIYDGERQLINALGEMAKDASEGDLKAAIQQHHGETKNHIARLDRVFQEIGEAPKRKSCHGIAGIINEGREVLARLPAPIALATIARKAEHYEISSYGSLCTWAEELGLESALQLLEENLSEEKAADEKLAQLAQGSKPERDHLDKLFRMQLREMYDAEHLLAQALSELQFYSVSKLLKTALWFHAKQTDKHYQRLEKAFKALDIQSDRRACKGVEGIIDDAQVFVLEFLGNSALDAAVIAAGQKAEHYEIITYEGLCDAAKVLGEKEVLGQLEDNLADEKQTDKALTLLATTSLNKEALEHDSPKKTEEEAELAKVITHGQ